jgi:hypothetical protein
VSLVSFQLSGMDKWKGVHGLLSVPVSFIIVNTMKNGKTNGGFRYWLRDGRMGKFTHRKHMFVMSKS